MAPKKSPQEAQATNVATQDQATMGQMYNTAQGTLGQYEGKTPLDTPVGKALLATSTDATSNAYQNAQAASADKAKAAGFGYNSPIGQSVSRETQGAEAGALAQLPAQVTSQVAPMQLEATQQTGQMGTAAGAQGTQNLSTAGELDNAYQQRRQSFINGLIGTVAAQPWIK